MCTGHPATTQSADSAAAYRAAGVDLDSARDVVDVAKRAVKRTIRPDIKFGGLGGFSGAFQLPPGYKNPALLVGCDGVGTKLAIAQQQNKHTTIGQDLVAMCVNDLLAQGAEPLVFLDYMATGKLETQALAQILEGIADGCQLAGCTLAGGETAEMPGFYPAGKYDLAGFSVGVAEAECLYPRLEQIQPGDVLIGLASSGLHSNGYSLVRKIVVDEHKLDLSQSASPGAPKLEDWLLAPTKIYVKPVLALLKAQADAVNAMVHITGGGFFDNIPRALPASVDVELDTRAWPWLPVYDWLKHLGHLDKATLLHTFNCGIGYVLVVPENKAEAVLSFFNETEAGKAGGPAYPIGRVVEAKAANQPEAQVRWE